MDSVGKGEGGKIWENGIETCEKSCMKRDASPGSMHDVGCLGLVHWDDPEGWYGEGGGKRVQEDRKSTRLNSSHQKISYAVFCLKKKKIHNPEGVDLSLALKFNVWAWVWG